MTIQQFADEAARLLCHRCAEGEGVWPPDFQNREWSHGCDRRYDEHGTHVDIPPEPCAASVIHQLLRENETAQQAHDAVRRLARNRAEVQDYDPRSLLGGEMDGD